jgi:hypothetical protein
MRAASAFGAGISLSGPSGSPSHRSKAGFCDRSDAATAKTSADWFTDSSGLQRSESRLEAVELSAFEEERTRIARFEDYRF